MPVSALRRQELPVAGWIILGYGVILVAAGPIRFAPQVSLGVNAFQLALLEIPAIAVVYGGYWVQQSDFDPLDQRRILDWCGWGTLLIGGLTVGAVGRELLLGSSVPDLEFFLFLGVSAGAAGGLVFGVKDQYTKRYADRVETQAEEVKAQREALFFLNRLLRHNVLNEMNVVKGYVEEIRYDETQHDEEDAAVVLQQCDRIVDLIHNVHTLGKAFAGEGRIEYLDLSAMLQDEVDAARREHPQGEFEAEIPSGVHIRNIELLSSVFEHLLRNAIEHNHRHTPHVSIHLESLEESVRVQISDNGPGIPDDRKVSVFETDEWGETGIGLYLAKTLVTNFGGDIYIRDNEPTGTVMTVELPEEADGEAWTWDALQSASTDWQDDP